MNLPVTIKLQKPVYHGEEEITELVFNREMEFSDMFDLPAEDQTMGDLGRIISRLADLPLPVIKKLKPVDARRAMSVVRDFLHDGLATVDDA